MENQKPSIRRIGLSVVFWIVYRISVCVILILGLFQLIYAFATSAPHEKVQGFTQRLSKLSADIVAYLGMNSGEEPCIKDLFNNEGK